MSDIKLDPKLDRQWLLLPVESLRAWIELGQDSISQAAALMHLDQLAINILGLAERVEDLQSEVERLNQSLSNNSHLV